MSVGVRGPCFGRRSRKQSGVKAENFGEGDLVQQVLASLPSHDVMKKRVEHSPDPSQATHCVV